MNYPRRRGLLAAAFGAALCAGSLRAQPPMPKPGEVIKYGIGDKGSPKFEGNTIILPTVFLNVGIEGDVWKISKSGGATAKAHALYVVDGWDKAYLQDLAKKVQDDFASQLRAGGFTVKLYDDVKDDPAMKEQDREAIDKDRGMPLDKDHTTRVTYALATPTDEQAIKGGLRTFTWALRGLAKNQNALVVVPVYPVRAPQMKGEGGGSGNTARASVEISPEFAVGRIWLYEVNAKEQGGTLFQNGETRLIAPDVGTPVRETTDRYSMLASIGGVKTVYRFDLDREKFTAAVMRATSAFNAQMVEELKKRKK